MHLFGTNEKIVAVADIGGGSAAFALARARTGAPPEIFAAARAILPIAERDSAATIAGVGQKLSEAAGTVLATYAKEGRNEAAEGVVCAIRTPWTHARTARAESKFRGETAITADIITNLAKEAAATIADPDPENFLEASAIRVDLNGYPTAHPEGKRACEIAVTVLVSDCDMKLRAAAEHALGMHLPHVRVVFRSGARALLAALQSSAEARADYFLVDVSGEATAMSAVREGALAEQASSRSGARSILKRLRPKAMPEETLSMMRMLAREECESDACEELKKRFALLEPELVRTFGETIAGIAAARRLPNTLILLTYPDLAPWLERFFGRLDFAQFTQTAQPFAVETLDPARLAGVARVAPGVVADSGILIAAALVLTEAPALPQGAILSIQ